MNSKIQITAAVFLLSLGPVLAEPTAANLAITGTFDPTTGLPVAPASSQPDWKDSNWKDPGVVLKSVEFNGVPLGDIAKFIRDQFKGQFDIILPNPTAEGVNELTHTPVPATDWRTDLTVNLLLKDVTATELFNAMNLMFENDKTPLQWQLKVIGHRQIALLSVLVDPVGQNPHAQEPERRIYFVGDLIGDAGNGGMSMDQIIKTITDVWQMTDNTNGRIQFHNEAQLLVVSGTPGQIAFVDQTLNALHQKVSLARRSLSESGHVKMKDDESKKQ